MEEESEITDLAFRTRFVCSQLTRYGNSVFCIELAELLDVVAEINDDLNHARTGDLLLERINEAKAVLDKLYLNDG